MVDSFICNFIKYLISSNFFILKNGVIKYGCNYLTMKEITILILDIMLKIFKEKSFK